MASSILSQIYKQGEAVVDGLQDMNLALKVMRDKDKQEYSADAKQRKYDREQDKRNAQDQHKFQKKVFDTAAGEANAAKKGEGTKKLAAGLSVAIAGAIKGAIAKSKGEPEPQTPAMGGGTRGMFTPVVKEKDPPVTQSKKSLDPSSKRVDSPKLLIPTNETLEQRVADLENSVFTMTPKSQQKALQKLQSGGFAGPVPNLGQPATGDHFYTHVQPGSYILNRNAVAGLGFQGGGTVPVALEQGEIAIPPGQYDQGMMDFLNYQAFPRFQQGGKAQKNVPAQPGDVVHSQRYLATTDAMNRANKGFQDIQKFLQGGLVLFQGHGDVPPGQAQGTDGPGTEIEGKYKPNAEQHFVDRVAALAASMSDKIEYRRPAGKFNSGTDKGANWQQANYLRSKGEAAMELHFDAYGMQNGKFIKGNRGMLIGGRTLKGVENNVRNAFGVHPLSGKGWGTLMLEMDHVGNAPGNTQKYAEMLVKAVGDGGEGGNETATPGESPTPSQAPGVSSRPTSGVESSEPTQAGPGGFAFLSALGPVGQVMAQAFSAVDTQVFGGSDFSLGRMFSMMMGGPGLVLDGFSNVNDFLANQLFGGPANAATNPQSAVEQIQGAQVPAAPGAPGTSATSANVDSPNAKALLNAIARAEGTTKSYGTMFGGKVNSDLASGNLTVRQAIAAGDRNAKRYGSGATGRYQFMPQTLEGLVRNGSLKMDEKFTNRRQDEAALALVAGRGVSLDDGLSMKEIQKLSLEWASIKGNNYTFGGRPQAYVNQKDFMKWYTKGGGKPQGRRAGGRVGQMKGRMDSSLQNFYQQNEIHNDRIANADVIPPVVQMGGGGAAEQPVVTTTSGSNLPEFDIPIRDSCPLSIYYRFEPSFNPNGMGSQ